MKTKFLLALTAASLMGMAACTKNDQLDATTSKEVGFSTYVNANTKGLAKTEFKIGDNFAVMATRSVNAWTPDDATWFMGAGTDQFITVTNTPSSAGASLWKYNPVVLWPESEAVSFFAFSPAPTATDNYGIADVTAVKGSPTLKYEVNADIKKQVDLLRAEALDKFEEEIQLQFGHALTKVSFAAKANVTANQRVRLDAIKLVGIKNTGELQLYDKDRQLGALKDMGGWSNQAGAVEFKPALTHEIVGEVPTTLTAMTAEDQTLFMIPQEFTTDEAKLEITYSYSHDGGQKWVNGSILPIKLNEATRYWNPGKSYRYVLTLAPADIYEFTADIIKWDDQIDVKVDKVVSSTSLSPNPAAFVSTELVVNETRGEERGYTLTSNSANWLTISENADGKNAATTVIYNADGTTTTKAYDSAKKWYLQTKPNITGKKRTLYVKLDREKMDSVRIDVTQESVSPFVNCVPASLENLSGGATSDIYEVKGLLAPVTTDTTYKITASGDWFTLSLNGTGAGAKELTVTQIDAPISFFVHLKAVAPLSGDITFTVTPKSGTAIEVGKFKVSQNVSPANTYISVNGADVIFDATRKPRSAMDGKVGALAHQGYNTGTDAGTSNYYTGGAYTAGVMNGKQLYTDLNKADISYVQVVWQTMKDHGKGIDTGGEALNFKSYNPIAKGTAFIKSVAYDKETGLVTVKTNGTGNALVAAYDINNTILWSWQIWGTEGEPQANVTPGDVTANGTGKMLMDRNLGALAATATKPSEADAYKYFGTLYQWGRKEPFTSAGPQFTTIPNGIDVNSTPTAIFDKNGKWMQSSDETGNAKPLTKTKGGFENIASAATSTYALLANPTAYYNGNVSVITTDPNTWTPYSAGITKSIYDPCPYGYRVLKDGSWTGFPRTNWTKYSIDGGIAWHNSWWPASGYRDNGFTSFYGIGYVGRYWSASRNTSTAYKAYNLTSGFDGGMATNDSYLRSTGFAVRCVQE